MKNVFFLRHGETRFNKRWIHQYASSPLSSKGRQQAYAVADKFKKLSIEIIVTSPYTRTKETAEIISSEIKAPIIESKLLVELRRPSTLHGASWFSLKSIFVMGMLYFMIFKKNWHFSDEENLVEFQERSKNALDMISHMQEKNILVVTHGGFISNILSSIRHDGMETIYQFRRGLWKTLSIGNCCFVETTWLKKGVNGETLEGTWVIKKEKTCPQFKIGENWG